MKSCGSINSSADVLQAIVMFSIVSLLLPFWQKKKKNVNFPIGASGKEPVCQCRRHKRCRFESSVRKIPWRIAWQPTPGFLQKVRHN